MPYNAYLRALRVQWCLSQEELAELLGVSQARVSRYEQCEEHPTLSVLFGLQVIFNRTPRWLFKKPFLAVEEDVMRRAAEFERSLIGTTDFKSCKKRQLLEGMVARATNREEA